MSLEEGLLIFFFILCVYLITAVLLHKKGVLKKYNISFYGPFLMWRTEKGKKFIDLIARNKKFWVSYANIGVVICFIIMILMVLLLIFIFPLTLGPEETIVSSHPQIALGLPGLNPIIPLWYGILGLLVALIVHELSHGILVRAGELKVKSLGLLLFILPIGAFCEPDEEELKKTSIKKRMRVFSAGPTANIVTAFVCLGLISLMMFTSVQPGAEGVGVISVVEDAPADEIGLKPGMIITSINGSKITGISDFNITMNNLNANQTVEICLVYKQQNFTKNVKLADKYPLACQESIEQYGFVNTSLVSKFREKGYLGVSVTTKFKQDLSLLKNPFHEFPFGFMLYIGIPFTLLEGYSSISSPFTNYYVVDLFIPENIFWVIINSLYWVFWINFMVATFNVLPMIPLDGGYMFRDTIDSILRKIRVNLSQERREKIIANVTTIVSLFILFLVLAPILIPNIIRLF